MHFCKFLSLWIPLVAIKNVFNKELEFHERNKTMINQADSGHFSYENHYTFDWYLLKGKSPAVNEVIQKIAPFLIQTYTEQEVEFCHRHPDAVGNEHFLKSLAPLFQENPVDWKTIEDQIRAIFSNFFTATDFSQYCKEQDQTIFVISRDATTGSIVGGIQFLISSDYGEHGLKAGLFAVQSDNKEELIKLLLSSIYKLKSNTQKMYIHVRSTNQTALSLYRSLGFVDCAENSGYWVNQEYISQKHAILQEIAEQLS